MYAGCSVMSLRPVLVSSGEIGSLSSVSLKSPTTAMKGNSFRRDQ
jgi:hypothetical protein